MALQDFIEAAFARLTAAINAVDAKTGGGGGSGDWTYVFLVANAISTVTARADTGLQFTPQANSHYEIEGKLYLQAAATTTGVRFGLKWPTASVLQNAARIESPSSATAGTLRFWGNTAAADVAATGVPVANEGIFGKIDALLRTGPAPVGNFIVTIASEIAASEARIMANSFIRYRKIA